MAKVLISIEDALLPSLDAQAREQGLSRSAYLSGLVRGDLRGRQGPGASPAVASALAEIRRLFRQYPGEGEDTATMVRRMRDERSDEVGRRPY